MGGSKDSARDGHPFGVGAPPQPSTRVGGEGVAGKGRQTSV